MTQGQRCRPAQQGHGSGETGGLEKQTRAQDKGHLAAPGTAPGTNRRPPPPARRRESPQRRAAPAHGGERGESGAGGQRAAREAAARLRLSPSSPAEVRAEPGNGGGRQTLRGRRAPPQNGGHLRRGLFSLPNDRPGATPTARFGPALPDPPSLWGAAAAAVPPSPSGMRRIRRRDVEQKKTPHLKWRPPRLAGRDTPACRPPSRRSGPAPAAGCPRRAGLTGRQARLRRASPRRRPACGTHSPSPTGRAFRRTQDGRRRAAGPRDRAVPPRSPPGPPGDTHLRPHRPATAQWERTKALPPFIA